MLTAFVLMSHSASSTKSALAVWQAPLHLHASGSPHRWRDSRGPWAWRGALLTTLLLALAAWVVMLAGLAALQANCSNTGSPAVRLDLTQPCSLSLK